MSYVSRGRSPMSGPDNLDRILPYLPVAIAVLLGLILATNAFYTVQPEEKAVVFRFGKYASTTSSGLHFKIPLVDRVVKVNIAEHSLRLPYGVNEAEADPADSLSSQRSTNMNEGDTLILTGDLNTAAVEWTLTWKVTTPQEYVVRFPNAQTDEFANNLITNISRSVMNRLVGDYSFDEVLNREQSAIADGARDEIQEVLDGYQCGLSISSLQMQRVRAPLRVRPAFDNVVASIQEKQKYENEGEAERNKLLPEARAEKDRIIREAEGYADRRRAEANGEIAALRAQAEAYLKAPDVTRRRLYLEAMQEVLSKIGGKTILDAGVGRQVIPLLPINPDPSATPSGNPLSRFNRSAGGSN